MKALRLIISLLICAVLVFLTFQIISESAVNQQNKQDMAEINHIKYGLFSINRWKVELAEIISDEIQKLNLTKSNVRLLKKHVEGQLDVLINNVEKKMKDTNKGSAKGWLKQAFINAFVDINEIKAGIPSYADAIIVEMTKSQTENRLKNVVKRKIDQYFDKTFETQDLSALEHVFKRTDTKDVQSARVKLIYHIGANQELILIHTWILIALSLTLFIVSGWGRRTLEAPEYGLMLVTLASLLFAGVSTPMIDMEAKISEMSFVLLNHPVSFVNQVLYFQSKSILDVFWIMITHADFQMKFVGLLIIAFSIVLPVLKLVSSVAYFHDCKGSRGNRFIEFLVLKSGKWSMSDVLVVAIFMAYIGFNGIITSQFGYMNKLEQDVVVLSTNGTSLQHGFFIFLTYALLAMFLTGYLERNPKAVVSNLSVDV
ncbi:MAG: paraquat-inducible protein A [Bdellovibrionales bacterium]|nr:paraquat-inducible protein A [Bdellovibrionales bacterium]